VKKSNKEQENKKNVENDMNDDDDDDGAVTRSGSRYEREAQTQWAFKPPRVSIAWAHLLHS